MKRRTPTEQRIWDETFVDLVVECVRAHDFERALGCLHLAREVADEALIERRNSIKDARKPA